MRILVLSYEFPPLGGGGGRVAEDLCRYFVMHGHEVFIYTTGFKGFPKVEKKYGYTIRRIFSFRKKLDRCSIPEMFLYVLTNILPVFYHVLKWRPHVIQCHFAVPTGVVGWLIASITKIPYVITAHLGDVPGGVPQQTDKIFKIVKPFTIPIWRNAAAITAVSDYVAELAVKAYNCPVQIIYNGIEIGSFNDSDIFPHDPVRMIFVGRFNPQKNLLFFVSNLNLFEDLNWTLDLVGDGELMSDVKNAVINAGMESRVKFHGWLEPDRADEIMSSCDVLVLPSLYEGMPVVGVKALRYGLAIIASDIKGVTGIIKNGVNGYVFPVNDAQKMKSVLRQVMTNRDILTDMRKKSREMVLSFDLSVIAEQYETVFQKVIA